jgi:hypothetical protein
MLQACKYCHKQYDNTKQRSDCPHKEFPIKCSEHDRYNCGNPECAKAKLLRFKQLREEEIS